MNPFIARKLRIGLVCAISLYALVCIGIGYWQYQINYSEQTRHYFNQEQVEIEQLSNEINQATISLAQQGNILQSVLDNIGNSYGYIENNNSSSVSKVDLFTNKVQNGLLSKNSLINQFEPIVSASMLALNSLSIVSNAFIAWQENDHEYEYMSHHSNRNPIEVIKWLALHRNKIKALLGDVYTVPPIKAEVQNKSYIIYSLKSFNKTYHLVLELEFNVKTLLEFDNETLIWHSESGFLVHSNIDNYLQKRAASNNPLLAVSFLPQTLRKFVLYEERDETPFIIRHELMESDEQNIIAKANVAGGLYKVIMFKSNRYIVAEVIQKSSFLALVVFFTGLLVLISFYHLLVWKLAKPTSLLMEYIDNQSSIFETKAQEIPKGWHYWFNKIKLSFKDNRQLLTTLTDKNKELDQLVIARTKELMQQTVIKDRNLALNRSMMNSIPDLMYFKNVSGGYLGCNKAYEDYIGLSEDKIVAKTALDVLSPDIAQKVDILETNVIRSKTTQTEQALTFNAKGERLVIDWLLSPILGKDNEVLGILGLGRDVTEQESNITELSVAAAESERANQIKGEFIANISHEIRTPMNSIIGMLQLLDDTSQDSNQKSYIKIADNSARNLLSVINNILDFSKGNADKLEVEEEVFGLSSVLDSAFANSMAKAMRKGLILDTKLPMGLPEYVIGDHVKLGQIFTNLIGNAVKFTHLGSVVVSAREISSNNSHTRIEFKVSDTGIGIAKDKQKSVFDAFSQADSSVTREYGGTGLGLTIVYQLVEALGGEIELESEEKIGTTFTLTFEFGRILEQPQYDLIQHNWLYWDTDQTIIDLLQDKLASIGTHADLLNLKITPEQFEIGNTILLCRLERLIELPEPILTLIKLRQLLLQPITFNIVTDNNLLSELPHFPLVTAPFNAQTMLLNIHQHQMIVPSKQRLQSSLLNGIKVLIVEDNEINQQVLSLILNAEKADITVVENGMKALSTLMNSEFDVVITDIQMPVMDGLTLAKKIRANEQLKNIPIIAVSAHANKADKIISKNVGINHYLTKPIDKNELFRALAECCLTNENDLLKSIQHTLDVDFLLKQFDDSIELIRTVLHKFYDSQCSDIEIFIQQINTMDINAVQSKLHSLKGMLGNLGANDAYEATKLFEIQVKVSGKVNQKQKEIWEMEIQKLLSNLTTALIPIHKSST